MLRAIFVGIFMMLSFSLSAQSLETKSEVKVGGLTVQLIDPENQKAFSFYQYRGGSMIAGNERQAYWIQVTNHQTQRIEILIGVENIDPRTGTQARLGQAGYVLEPGQTLRMKNDRKGKPFVFPNENMSDPRDRFSPALQLVVYQEVNNYPYTALWNAPKPLSFLDISKDTQHWSSYVPPLFRRNENRYPQLLLVKLGALEHLQSKGILEKTSSSSH